MRVLSLTLKESVTDALLKCLIHTISSNRPVLQRTISNDTNTSSSFSSVSQSKYRFLTPQYNDRIIDLSAQYNRKVKYYEQLKAMSASTLNEIKILKREISKLKDQ